MQSVSCREILKFNLCVWDFWAEDFLTFADLYVTFWLTHGFRFDSIQAGIVLMILIQNLADDLRHAAQFERLCHECANTGLPGLFF